MLWPYHNFALHNIYLQQQIFSQADCYYVMSQTGTYNLQKKMENMMNKCIYDFIKCAKVIIIENLNDIF